MSSAIFPTAQLNNIPPQLVYYSEFSMYDILNLVHWILSDHSTTGPRFSVMKSKFMCHWCSNVSVYLSPCGTAFCLLRCRKWLPHHHCINSYFIELLCWTVTFSPCIELLYCWSLGFVTAESLFKKQVKSHLAPVLSCHWSVLLFPC